jgi:putative transcriptional regulator
MMELGGLTEREGCVSVTMMNDPDLADSLAGRLLLAMPDMPDVRFRRSVIALCAHDEQGALGIGLGEPVVGLGLHELLRTFDIPSDGVPDGAVLAGGPVEVQRGFVLHSADWTGDDSLDIGDDLMLTASLEVLRVIGNGTGPREFVVALGYAGWGAGQLERELAAPGWFVAEGDPRRLFPMTPQARWAGAFALDGIDPAMLAITSGIA